MKKSILIDSLILFANVCTSCSTDDDITLRE